MNVSETEKKKDKTVISNDYLRFELARASGLADLHNRAGIGTLMERSLHSVLKFWADDDPSHHEISIGIGRIVADVFDGERVTEIQTGGFSSFRKKLERILEVYPVTVIYPICHIKRLAWVDPETGESSKPRKSPKAGRVWDAFMQLLYIPKLLLHENLVLKIVMLDMDEYKLLNGWGNGGKRGAHRIERVPTAFVERFFFVTKEDYIAFIKDNTYNLPDKFTVKDFMKSSKTTLSLATKIVYTLYKSEIILRTGKQGNAYIYQISE